MLSRGGMKVHEAAFAKKPRDARRRFPPVVRARVERPPALVSVEPYLCAPPPWPRGEFRIDPEA